MALIVQGSSGLQVSGTLSAAESPFPVTLEELKTLRPRAVLAVCPSHYDTRLVAKSLQSPTCLIFGEKGDAPGSRWDGVKVSQDMYDTM